MNSPSTTSKPGLSIPAMGSRAVPIGVGYRALMPGELILENDEYYLPREQRWYRTSDDGKRHDDHPLILRRRKIEVGSTLPTFCRWEDCEQDGWKTACGEAFVFIDGGPKENKFRFCPYCGHAVREPENQDLMERNSA